MREELNHPLITARVIADSINASGNRLTTLVITIPRIVLAEFNTHRAISRNSASSRAIPFKKMLEEVTKNPFIPTKFQKSHKGMQGTEYFTDEEVKKIGIKHQWLGARDFTVSRAKVLHDIGVTKQLCNRLLEPFLMHTIIATATEWENFIALRAHEDAEIHIQDAAYKVLDAINNSTPKMLKPGEWHIPFGDKIDTLKLSETVQSMMGMMLTNHDKYVENAKLEIAVARCARVSYMNFEGKDDYEADIKLYNRLLESGHMSPFEHVAQVPTNSFVFGGNFKGWNQYRKMMQGENKADVRLK